MNVDYSDVETILKKYFTYDRIFNLVEYDSDMSRLYLELKELQKDSYDPTYRFIFAHHDTDYHITQDQPGLMLRNLQRLLQALDISNYFCLILSNQQIQNQLDILRNQETNDAHSIYSIAEWAHPWLHPQINQVVERNIDHITKKYICLNGTNRYHRSLLYSFLYNKKLLEDGIVSYKSATRDLALSSNTLTQNQNFTSQPLPPDLTLISTDPFARINDRWFIKDPAIITMLQTTPTDSYKNFSDTFGRLEDPAIALAQQAFLYIVTETTFDYPVCLLSEKVFKPIVARRPFLLVSGSGSLKTLKDLGFKTFNRWWNEDYDSMSDPTERMKAVLKIIETILCKSITELKDMYQEMQEVIDYNFDYHQTNFYNDQLNNIDNACKNNLGYR